MFRGNSRFRLVRQLGAGGMGIVYEAEDQQRNVRVALKTLQRADPDLLYRLKREFRSLRDLVHHNLVGLGDLFEQDGEWFFTMELIDGKDLLGHLQQGGRAAAIESTAAFSVDREVTATQPARAAAASVAIAAPPVSHAAPPGSAIDYAQVREVFAQIAEGLVALHDAGKVHRDIKPSNILVARDGRCVILDFGLVTEHASTVHSSQGEIVGSVPYMAPEQAAGQSVDPAADWYSVGVMLYEVIARRRPFDGPVGVVIAAKQFSAPRDLRRNAPDCPEDLAELCMRLLRVDPQGRPDGREVLDKLGAARRSEPVAAIRPPSRLFVGREAELGELRRAFEDVRAGGAVTAMVHGESGIGKTTLLQQFTTVIERDCPGVVVLAGQCREHEAVPFKALDGVVDALVRYICSLPPLAAAELVPHNAALLPGMFPVLERIAGVANAPRPLHTAGDPFQQRQRVFVALRDLLGLMTERYQLICLIEDMQWVDSDSLHLLGELLRPPDQPRMLLLASVRTRDGADQLPPVPGDVRRIRLERLNHDDSVALADMLLDCLAPEQKVQTTRIVEETAGHPLYIGELVRYAAAVSAAAMTQLRLDEAIWARASQLGDAAMRVLAVLAAAIAPLPEDVAHAASELEASAFQKALLLVRASNLVRGAIPAHASLEVYHDRVRQAVLKHLDEARRIAIHQKLAAALDTAEGRVPPELVIYHLEGAAQFDQAARKAAAAADRAQASLAFEQAVQFFETALRLGGWSESERRELLIKLGGALASAGRGPQAAEAYARAAERADPDVQVSCRIQMADQLVQSGLLERGATLLFSLIREQGHGVPRSQIQLALRILWYRFKLTLRGLRWTDRPRSSIGGSDLALLMLYHAASRGLILFDPVRASYFVVRGLHLALDVGDRDLIMYFLVLEAGFRGGEGGRAHGEFLARADELMRKHDEPAFQAIYRLHKGSRAYLAIDHQFKEACEMLERSDEELAQTANAAWWLSAGRNFLVRCLHKIGDFARLRGHAERFMREAEQRGNVYSCTTINRQCNVLRLVDDDPEAARADLSTDSWISYTHGYHTQHWLELNARIEIAIYEGSTIDRQYVARHLRMLKESFLQRVLGYACDAAWLVGRLALSELPRDPSRRRVVRRSIATLEGYATEFTRVLAAALRGTLAIHDRDAAAATAALRDAIALGDAIHLLFIPAALRRRLGALVGGDEGAALIAAGERWMRDAGIKNVERMTELASPCGQALLQLGETSA